jgi:hypothetical protein
VPQGAVVVDQEPQAQPPQPAEPPVGIGGHADVHPAEGSTIPNARTRNLPRPDDPSKGWENLGDAAETAAIASAPLGAVLGSQSLIETHAAMSAGIKALVPALTSGVVAVGKWAEEHPVAAKAILETLKVAAAGVAGAAAGVAGSAAKRIINASPD